MFWKKETENIQRRKISDVFFRAKDKVVSIHEKVFLFEINIDELKRLFLKYKNFLKYSSILLVLAFVVVFSLNLTVKHFMQFVEVPHINLQEK